MPTSSSSFVAFVGSRSWSLPVPVARALHAVLARSFRVGVGCCVGADAAVLQSLSARSASAVEVWCAFGPAGVGAVPPVSAVGCVAAAAELGAGVRFWAGGGPAVPVRARLASRTRALVSAPACCGVVAFLASGSVGAVAACRLAAGRGLPVVAFSASGAAPAPLFSGGPFSGSWVPAAPAGEWAGAWQWVSAQCALFPAPAPWVSVPRVRGRTR